MTKDKARGVVDRQNVTAQVVRLPKRRSRSVSARGPKNVDRQIMRDGVPIRYDAMSDRLKEKLPLIAASLVFVGKLGIEGANLSAFDPEILRELGFILGGISRGYSAKFLFRESEKTKPPRYNRSSIALVYWYTRACDPASDDSAAIARVRAASRLSAPKAKATIVKYAQLHRDAVLDYLAECARTSRWHAQLFVYNLIREPGWENPSLESISDDASAVACVNAFVTPLDAEKVEKLKEYLRKKSKRPNMDK